MTLAPPGRPPGDVRQALVAALRDFGPAPMRDIAAHAQVGFKAAEGALKNMVNKSGVVQIVGHEKRAHCRKWVALYDLVVPAPAGVDACSHGHGWVDLGRCVQGWAR